MKKLNVKKTLTSLAVASLFVAGTAQADLNYNYVEGGLGIWSPSSQTLIGPDIRASFAATEDVFIYGGFRFLTDDIDYTNFHVGAGYRFALNGKTDIWGGANIEYQELESCLPSLFGSVCGSVDDTSLALRGGARHQLNDELEVGGSLRLVTGDFDYLGLNGHARYKLADNLDFKGELDIQDGDLGLFAGVTYYFK